jgi:uncharacterized repeat protein (TIGR03803 family)
MKNEKIVPSTIAHSQRLKSFRTNVALVLTTLTLVVAATTGATAQTFKTIYSFCSQSNCTDGGNPYAGLVQATNGHFYGTTNEGTGAYFEGTVFEIAPNGGLTTLHTFSGAEGGGPYAGLVQATSGNFYGTTYFGGAYGYGSVFKITPSGKLTTLHSFDYTDDDNPYGALVQATNGDFYGTTYGGGTNNVYGTVFKITPSGKLTTLYSFAGTDGGGPYAGLVQAINGDFYGTTVGGGTNDYGTVFKITPSGKLTTLHSFDGTDGAYPYAGLVQATNGDFYGTTGESGTSGNGYGTVFKITPSGDLMPLHSFAGTDGGNPYAGLAQATSGDFYGTTRYGGANITDCGGIGCGTVFKITPSGKLTTLHSFDRTDGASPYAGLVQATSGDFYGTTDEGGANNYGTVFRLAAGLGPFVKTQPTSGTVGAAVKILGTSLTGATGVTFNGTAAVFKVVSSSEITTAVPTGATTGTVEVTTPKGTLKSNVAFRVTQ